MRLRKASQAGIAQRRQSVRDASMTASTHPPAGRSELTPEDLSRSRDRLRVLDARQNRRAPLLLWLLTGPGVLAMLGENDGPSMLSYAATGASYGIGFFLPFIAVTFLAAFVVQEMAMRLGAVTHRGYGELIFQRFGPFWGWLSAGDLVVTNLITLVTEIIAIRVGMAYFGIPPVLSVAFAVVLVAVSTSGGRYWRQIQNHLHSYYGTDPLWGGQGFYGAGLNGFALAGGVGMAAFGAERVPEPDRVQLGSEDGDQHLRSMLAVTGYHIHATDGAIGHVENFLLDDTTWTIRYLIVDTRNWWPGAHVLISPFAVQSIEWIDREIQLNITQEQVKGSPPWNPSEVAEQVYERQLHRYYNWPGYGW